MRILADGIIATCRIGATDIAATLVRNGLVEIEGDIANTDLMKAQALAKSQKLGIWDR
jgi:endonuclease YncB( thermonuclease family)